VEAAVQTSRRWWNLAAAGLAVRLALAPSGGYPSDVASFKAWAVALAAEGPAAFYGARFADYLPGYLYVLWMIGRLDALVHLNDVAWLVALKLPAVLADLAAAWLVLHAGVQAGHPGALRVAASWLFNPGVVFTSAVWGQVDAVGAACLLAGLWALARPHPAPLTGAAWLAAAVATKPQVAPALLAAGLALVQTAAAAGRSRRWRRPALAAAVFLAVVALLARPFDLTPAELVRLLRDAAGVYPYGSVMAFNLWGALQGFWIPDAARWAGLPLVGWGLLLSVVAAAGVAALAWRADARRALLPAAAVILLAAFALPTRVHERYLFPALLVLAVAGYADRRCWLLYGVTSGLFALNVLYAYSRPYLHTVRLPVWLEATLFAAPVTRALGTVAVAALAWGMVILWGLSRGPRETAVPATTDAPARRTP
jgi:Gpi18-like mannosyltransferase